MSNDVSPEPTENSLLLYAAHFTERQKVTPETPLTEANGATVCIYCGLQYRQHFMLDDGLHTICTGILAKV